MNMDGTQRQIDRCAALLAPFCEQVVISQAPDSDIRHDFPIVFDAYGDIGPCGAILSIMESQPNADWLIMACDLPLIDFQTIQQLCNARENTESPIAFASRIDHRAEPLCAIYRATSFDLLKEWIGNDKRCARHFLENLNPNLLELINVNALDNANTPAELLEIQHKMAHAQTEKAISVLYFAQLRELAGKSNEARVTKAHSAAGLYDELRVLYGFQNDPKHLRVAINGEFAEWTTSLNDGDELVFIPPVAGG